MSWQIAWWWILDSLSIWNFIVVDIIKYNDISVKSEALEVLEICYGINVLSDYIIMFSDVK